MGYSFALDRRKIKNEVSCLLDRVFCRMADLIIRGGRVHTIRVPRSTRDCSEVASNISSRRGYSAAKEGKGHSDSDFVGGFHVIMSGFSVATSSTNKVNLAVFRRHETQRGLTAILCAVFDSHRKIAVFIKIDYLLTAGDYLSAECRKENAFLTEV